MEKPSSASFTRRAGVALCLFATAASSALGEALTWPQAMEAALRANPEVLAAERVMRAAELSERSTYGAFFPQVGTSLGWKKEWNGKVGTRGVPWENYTAGLSANLNLFSGFLDSANVDAARARREEARAAYDAARAKISFDLKSTFSGLLYAQRLIELATQFLERRDANRRLIELRFESGRENKGSVLLSRAYVDQAKLDLLQANNALAVSQAELARVLGLNQTDGLKVAGEVPTAAPPAGADIPTLVRQTPEYRISVAKEKAAEAGVTIARAPFLPSLNVEGAVGRGGIDYFPSEHQQWKVVASITIPLFNGGRDYYATRSASELRKAAVLSRENVLRSGAVKLQQALSGFREAVQRLEVNRNFVEAVATRSRIARQKYDNGLMTFEDWDVIENDFISRQKNFLQSERDRTIAEAAWEQAQGRGVFP